MSVRPCTCHVMDDGRPCEAHPQGMLGPTCDCDGPHYAGIKIHWDRCATQYPNEPKVYAISNEAASNIEAFQAKHGRMPRGVAETLAAMLHGAEAAVDETGPA